ncbi:xanthine dehydrogenase family protein subunit M [Bradyrhizobium sp. AUGA SZCCT0182]|uniref:FAD binding domain-containing protein n=1 Tax=Bradyrhizobium sp. AUGA SZCCT0182 TaxID=2807667 RepID=UPI001BA6C9D1|nr:FAD binding domain-containing protein [Bradyrhizobium sp. AUGA SZCCT0182]MBR1231745.1 FAD binding domain-containing protein [Bradyrhizobium sp. AUGA SZCCT0182]
MKPRSFEYRRVANLEEAYELLSKYADDAKIIAGGQSLVPMMNLRLASPSVLVDIGGIDELKRTSCDGEVLRIGSLTRHRQVETDELIARNAPLLVLAVQHVAHLAVRNRGTFGGSICHADPAAEFPACSLLLQAEMELGSVRGIRSVPANEFFHGPFMTSVEADEVLLAVKIRSAASDEHFAFHELSRRQGDFAMSGVAARAKFAPQRIETRWVGFGVSGHPILLPAVTELFTERAFDAVSESEVRAAVDDDLPAEDDDVEKVMLQRTLTSELVQRCASDLIGSRERRSG